MRAKIAVILIALGILAVTVWPARQLGTEFMPNLNEGTLLYMPTTLPGLSVTKAAELLQMQDRIIRSFPEVESVYGKAGRAATATDPAPTEMFETIINLKPKAEWRAGLTLEGLTAEMDKALQISRRIERLDPADQGAHRHALDGHPHADRRQGDRHRSGRDRPARQTGRAGAADGAGHLVGLCRARHRRLLSRHRARPRGAGALRHHDPGRAGRHRDRARRADRDDHGRGPPALFRQHALSPRPAQRPQSIARDVLVPMPAGGAVPLGEVAKVAPARGPTSIRTENGQLAVYVYVDIRDRDIGGYVADAKQAVNASIQFPPGAYLMWSGQYEYLERAAARLKIVVPVTLAIIFLLLYLNFRSLTETLIVMLSLPFALVGGLWLMWWLGFNLSVAVVVGFIALAGVAAETGVVMLIYLNQALDERRARRAAEGGVLTRNDLYDAIMEGAVERVRPKMMTVVAIMAGLLPIMWSTGTGSEIMQRIAVPMIGGMISSTLLTLIVIPPVWIAGARTKSARCGDCYALVRTLSLLAGACR